MHSIRLAVFHLFFSVRNQGFEVRKLYDLILLSEAVEKAFPSLTDESQPISQDTLRRYLLGRNNSKKAERVLRVFLSESGYEFSPNQPVDRVPISPSRNWVFQKNLSSKANISEGYYWHEFQGNNCYLTVYLILERGGPGNYGMSLCSNEYGKSNFESLRDFLLRVDMGRMDSRREDVWEGRVRSDVIVFSRKLKLEDALIEEKGVI